MQRQIAIIFFLLFLAWQVISAIINHANASKQQQRAEELAKRRREAASTGTPASVAGRSGQSRIDDLAARRKAQLEELRQRRESAKSAKLRAGGIAEAEPARSSEPPRRAPIRTEPVGRAPERDPWQMRQEALKRERDAQARRKAEQSRTAQQRPAAERKAQLANQERERAAAFARTEARAARRLRDEAASDEVQVVTDDLRRKIHRPHELRELFILKELIDPPLAMRPPQQ